MEMSIIGRSNGPNLVFFKWNNKSNVSDTKVCGSVRVLVNKYNATFIKITNGKFYQLFTSIHRIL